MAVKVYTSMAPNRLILILRSEAPMHFIGVLTPKNFLRVTTCTPTAFVWSNHTLDSPPLSLRQMVFCMSAKIPVMVMC